jgi:MoaA/NifB/PqqE/SkfB family radical SAM enzyme
MITFEQLKSVHVELSSACNAACPNCPRNIHGGYTLPGLQPSTMSLDQFKAIFTESVLAQLERFLFCGNYGDPIYCKDLPDILKYVASVNPKIRIKVHTNGGIRSPEWWSDLANSYPTTHLLVVFSVDGLSDTNHIYRRNVVWERLVQNMSAFIQAGGVTVWEYLIFQHNEHQLEQARAMSERHGLC